jgi:hypothetical protein
VARSANFSKHGCTRTAGASSRDPLDFDMWPLGFAVSMTATRLAQALLAVRGWELSGGSCCGDSGFWMPETWELCKPGTPGYRSILGALRVEGLVDLPVPAVQPLITRPALRLVRGGKAA